MKSAFRLGALLGLLWAAGPSALAHPPVSLARDARGNIFYSDLAQVWQLAPNGTKSVAVPGVHTHELCLDPAGNLYGEHLWYEGDATKKWGHYLWRRAPDGAVTRVKPATEGFPNDYGFARDAAGNSYWCDREATGGPAIRRKSPDGAVTIARQNAAWRDVRWMTAAPNGTLYLVDRSDLVRISATGEERVLARRLSENDDADQRHKIQGLCADDAGNVWLAVFSLGVVKKVAPDGQVTIASRSHFPWAPCGVLATRDGQLWILECNPVNSVRVRHVAADGKVTTY